ncbi:MAG: ABC transporter permease [Oscillospiraceae bacterium]|nr:ABC transporter permease [Oscillospiraceae bacterium]
MTRKKQRDEKLAANLTELTRKQGQWREVLMRLVRNKVGMFGAILCIALVILCIGAPLFTKWDPYEQAVINKFIYPGREHIFGTDDFGRDLWARLIYGGRYSLLIAFGATCFSTCMGVLLGSIAGYFGGRTDLLITRFLDILQAIPSLLLAIAISSALGSGPFNTMLAISMGGIAGGARMMRSVVMSIRGNEYIEAAKATGSSNARTIATHVLPNTIAPLIINASLSIGGNIMSISGLSFIGLGVQAPTPEWGSILAVGKTYIRDFWPLVVFPSMFIAITIFGFNLFGDALRDALDPKLKD